MNDESAGSVVTISHSDGRGQFITKNPATVGVYNSNSICADPSPSSNADSDSDGGGRGGWWMGNASSIRYCNGKSVQLIAGDQKQSGDKDGVRLQARFLLVGGMVMSGGRERKHQRLYFSDSNNNKIRVLDFKSQRVSTELGDGRPETLIGIGRMSSIYCPTHIVFDRSSSSDGGKEPESESVLWIVSDDLCRFDLKTRTLTNPLRGVLPVAELCSTASACCTLNGTLIVATHNTLYSIDPRTRQLNILAGTKRDPGHKDGSGEQARFNAPSCVVVVDREQALYVSDRQNHCIRRVTLPPTLFLPLPLPLPSAQ